MHAILIQGGFWDFTWDEMAKYDIPIQIEKVNFFIFYNNVHFFKALL